MKEGVSEYCGTPLRTYRLFPLPKLLPVSLLHTSRRLIPSVIFCRSLQLRRPLRTCTHAHTGKRVLPLCARPIMPGPFTLPYHVLPPLYVFILLCPSRSTSNDTFSVKSKALIYYLFNKSLLPPLCQEQY